MSYIASPSTGKSFIVKLYKILNDQKYSKIITWCEDGYSLIVKNVAEMVQNLLPQIYKHSNYNSFVRQLNIYGFKKIPNQDGDHIYYHEHFNKHSKVDYSLISRKSLNKYSSAGSFLQSNLVQSINRLQQRLSILQKKVQQKNQKTQKFFVQKILLLQKQNHELKHRMSQQDKILQLLVSQSQNRLIQPVQILIPQFNSQIFTGQQLVVLNNKQQSRIQQKQIKVNLLQQDKIQINIVENQKNSEQIGNQQQFLLNDEIGVFQYV